jgi:hypothetical protein
MAWILPPLAVKDSREQSSTEYSKGYERIVKSDSGYPTAEFLN